MKSSNLCLHKIFFAGVLLRRNYGLESVSFCRTEANPSVQTVEAAAALYIESKADFIVAFGGGSPLDVAKAVAVLATYV